MNRQFVHILEALVIVVVFVDVALFIRRQLYGLDEVRDLS